MQAPWTCIYAVYGCADPAADNYASYVKLGGRFRSLSYMCEYGGCNDTDAINHSPTATYNDGTCQYPIVGCTVRT